MDIFMGAGGFGYFTSCNSDCDIHYCQGGGCRESMYEGTFTDWVNAQYNDPNLCYSGGIKWLDQKNQSELIQLCYGLVGNKDVEIKKHKSTIDSCIRTNMGLFHQNFVETRLSRVECPYHLTEITGLKRTDDVQYPYPHVDLPLDEECRGDRSQGHYCITTMQDCCKMSCSWSGKIPSYALDSTHACVYTCDRDGKIL
jgi:hypothetical protein